MRTLPIERAFALAVKIQAARGTGAAPDLAADALRLAEPFVVDVDWLSRNEHEGEQTGGKGSFGSAARAGRVHKYPIRRRLRGIGSAPGAANLPPEDALLMAILGAKTVVEGTSVSYSGADDDEAVLSVLAQTLKQQIDAIDCVPSSASIEWEAGKFITLMTELVGVGITPVDQALEAATLDTGKGAVVKGATFTLNGVALSPVKGNLDFGLTISEPILDGSEDESWSGHKISHRLPTGQMEVQITDLATFNPHALCAASTLMPWVFDLGAAATSNIRIEADKLEILKVAEGNRGGVKVWVLDYAIRRATSPSVKDPVIIFN